jgi:hypothetical protein
MATMMATPAGVMAMAIMVAAVVEVVDAEAAGVRPAQAGVGRGGERGARAPAGEELPAYDLGRNRGLI